MANIKLGDVCDFQNGYAFKRQDFLKSGIKKILKITNINQDFTINENNLSFFNIEIKNENKYKLQINDIVIAMSGATTGKIAKVHLDGFWLNQRVGKFIPKLTLKNCYLFYLLQKHKVIIEKMGFGSAQPNISWEQIKTLELTLPTLQVQQQIIDIIEPFENIKINLINKLEKLNNISNILINKYNKKELMINNCSFIKGKTPNTTDFVNYSKIPFINVSAINNNINKYLDQKKYSSNVNYGDVILSLDGTVGIVNNFIYGYNGYGYKVVSDNYENYKLYYSLKHTINQNIIINNTSGSVIKHASKSKNFLYVFWFENEYLLSICYKYEILIKKQILIVEKIINLLISNYII